jgi:hypothetical protein
MTIKRRRGAYTKNVSINTTVLSYKEKDLCKQFYLRVRMLQIHNQFPFEFFIFHVANEQNTHKGYTMLLMSMGLRPGVLDYCVLLPAGRVAFIEFKRNAKCKPTERQKEFIGTCGKLGIPTIVTCNVDEAVEWIKGLGG